MQCYARSLKKIATAHPKEIYPLQSIQTGDSSHRVPTYGSVAASFCSAVWRTRFLQKTGVPVVDVPLVVWVVAAAPSVVLSATLALVLGLEVATVLKSQILRRLAVLASPENGLNTINHISKSETFPNETNHFSFLLCSYPGEGEFHSFPWRKSP
jgi:hypothetical protein